MFHRFRPLPTILVMLISAAPALASDLALKRVVLSSGGVGYFEYEAEVDGNATLTLNVGLDQVDDVLKSLIVYDSAGSAGEITLPSREPLNQSFADLPFDRTALDSAASLLNALQGAEIRVTGPKPLTGRLVHVDTETVREADGTTRSRSRVALLTDAGLQQVALDDATGIAFVDPALQEKIRTALTRIAAYRDAGRRRLSLTVHGTGRRTVRVGYVVAMPLWKASYRLSLPADPKAATARLQGWAVLENFSGQAWNDIDLTLVSGNPVTFRQALYESYYVPRPSVPVEAGGHVLPPADTGTLGNAAKREAVDEPAPKARAPIGAAMALPHASFAAAAAPPPPAPIEAAAASEGTTQIAFTLPAKVTVGVGQSLVLPLLDRDLPARQIDLFQPATDPTHPLAAIELTNAGDTGLPPGVLTIYQQGTDRGATYLGDARLAALPIGDKRLLSFAVDSKVTVATSTAVERHLVKASIAQGVMRVVRTNRRTTNYRIKAATAPPLLLIEHRRLDGWTLVKPDPKTVEATGAAYRIPVALGSDKQADLAVTEEHPLEETIALADINDAQLGLFVGSSELDPGLRKALTDLAARRADIARQHAELDRLKTQREQLVDDESRYRDNLGALGNEAVLRKRELDKLTQAEIRIDQVSAAIATATSTLTAAEGTLASFVAGLNL